MRRVIIPNFVKYHPVPTVFLAAGLAIWLIVTGSAIAMAVTALVALDMLGITIVKISDGRLRAIALPVPYICLAKTMDLSLVSGAVSGYASYGSDAGRPGQGSTSFYAESLTIVGLGDRIRLVSFGWNAGLLERKCRQINALITTAKNPSRRPDTPPPDNRTGAAEQG